MGEDSRWKARGTPATGASDRTTFGDADSTVRETHRGHSDVCDEMALMQSLEDSDVVCDQREDVSVLQPRYRRAERESCGRAKRKGRSDQSTMPTGRHATLGKIDLRIANLPRTLQDKDPMLPPDRGD